MSKNKKTGVFRKMMAAYSLVITGVLVFTGAAFYVFTSRYLESEARSDMGRAAGLAANIIRRDQSAAVLYSRLLSDNYEIKTGVLNRDAKTVSEKLEKELETLGADFVSVAGVDGVVFGHVSRLKREGDAVELSGVEPLFLSPVFQRAEGNGSGAAGIEALFPQRIGVVAIAPVHESGNACGKGAECVPHEGDNLLIGYVRIGYYLDERFIERIKDLTGSDIAIEHMGAVFSSTFDVPQGGYTADEIDSSQYLIRREPVMAGGKPVAHLVTVYPKARFHAVQRRGLSVIAIIGVVAFGGFVAVSAWLANRITEPLGELARGVLLVEEGRMDYRIPYTRNDEIGGLAESFNRMTESLLKREEELRMNQEQLIESGKLAAVGELAAGVAHEIGNPLAAISGYLQLLQESEPEKMDHYITELNREVGFIDSIIRQLLDFSRPSKQRKELVNLDDAVDEALKMVSFHKSVKTVCVNRSRPDEPVMVSGDRQELIQAVMNLTLNAAQAMDGKGEIAVETFLESDTAVIKVSDTGPGIPRGDMARIFDPFYTTKRGGTGLGLSITFRIIEGHNGKIRVETPEGGGTVFWILLPYRAPV